MKLSLLCHQTDTHMSLLQFLVHFPHAQPNASTTSALTLLIYCLEAKVIQHSKYRFQLRKPNIYSANTTQPENKFEHREYNPNNSQACRQETLAGATQERSKQTTVPNKVRISPNPPTSSINPPILPSRQIRQTSLNGRHDLGRKTRFFGASHDGKG